MSLRCNIIIPKNSGSVILFSKIVISSSFNPSQAYKETPMKELIFHDSRQFLIFILKISIIPLSAISLLYHKPRHFGTVRDSRIICPKYVKIP